MKTFYDYINEKQNFIFGGKAGLTGKEHGTGPKPIPELEIGDIVYVYSVNIPTTTFYLKTKGKIVGFDYDTSRDAKLDTTRDPANIRYRDEESLDYLDCLIYKDNYYDTGVNSINFCIGLGDKYKVITIVSTVELKDKEVIEIFKHIKKTANPDDLI